MCRRIAICLALSGLAGTEHAAAQTPSIISRLVDAPERQRPDLAQSFLKSLAANGAPLRDAASKDSLAVTFIYVGDSTTTRAVSLQGGPSTVVDSAKSRLSRIQGTNVWKTTLRVPSDARFLYTFGVVSPTDTVRRIVRDTFNTHIAAVSPGVASSLFEGPNAKSLDLSVVRADVAKGTLTQTSFESKTLSQTRRIWTYLPAGFAPAQHLPLVVVFDGAPYTNAGYVPTQVILDNLIAEQRVRPVVAVLIDTPQPSRRVDLWLSEPFSDFITDELIPWARRTYGVSTDPRETAAAGSSLGGLTAMFVAMRRPDLVGRVISQSGSYWTGKREGSELDKAPEWITRTLAEKARLPLEVWMEVGAYESAASNPIGMMPTNRRLRDLLRAKGYSLAYGEFPGGHEYINWRASLGDALMYFFSPGAVRR